VSAWQAGDLPAEYLERLTALGGLYTVDEGIVDAFFAVLRAREEATAHDGSTVFFGPLSFFQAISVHHKSAFLPRSADQRHLTDAEFAVAKADRQQACLHSLQLATDELFAHIDATTIGTIVCPVHVGGHYVTIFIDLAAPHMPQVIDPLWSRDMYYVKPVLQWYVNWMRVAAPGWLRARAAARGGITLDNVCGSQVMQTRLQTAGTNSCPAFACFFAQQIQARRLLPGIVTDARCKSWWMDRVYRQYMHGVLSSMFTVV
jgi:hypothetical protein